MKSTFFSLIALMCCCSVASAQSLVVHESPISVRSGHPGELLLWDWRERCAADVMLYKLTDGRVYLEVPEGSAATLHFMHNGCELTQESVMTCGAGNFVITKRFPGLVRVESFRIADQKQPAVIRVIPRVEETPLIPQAETTQEIELIPQEEGVPLPPLEVPRVPTREPAEPEFFPAPVGMLLKSSV